MIPSTERWADEAWNSITDDNLSPNPHPINSSNLLSSLSSLSFPQSLQRPGIPHIKQWDISNINNSCGLLGVQKHHSTLQVYILYTINNSIKRLYSADKDVKIDTKIFLRSCNEDRNAYINRLGNKFIHLTQTHFMFHRKNYFSVTAGNRIMIVVAQPTVCSDTNKKPTQ
jgi:hypothetical protein